MSKVLRLYHGSTKAMKDPKLLKDQGPNDFGSGFYVTSDYNQAKNLAKRKAWQYNNFELDFRLHLSQHLKLILNR